MTWTIPPAAGLGAGAWQSLDLARDTNDPSLWTAAMTLAPTVDPGSVNFMVQAVNGIGRVTLDTNVGAFYQPGSIPGTPTFPRRCRRRSRSTRRFLRP